ncbi:MAG: anaerobic ribonucleoside-triphosphate reductase activating protein [Bacteroidales bacterium]|nr:anaerobic ribonucleoside-triphosphate reductase activating protein [Bacteroidales bacterium]
MLKCYSYDIVCQEIPDEISLAVNISGCPNRCPGCHSPWLWEDEGKEMTIELLSSLIDRYAAAITCFCFMGGDGDTSEIQHLAFWLKSEYPHLKTAWYSGREGIPDGFDIRCLNYLKLGPYIEALGGLKSPTTNQALYRVLPDGKLEKCTII